MPDEPSTSGANKLLGALLCALSALSLAALVLGRRYPESGALASFGSALDGGLSWASLFVPLWLGAAALLAFLPGWRPGAVAALIGSVLPFLPLAALARLQAAGDSFLADRPYLAAAGMPAIEAAILAISLALAAFVVYAARSIGRANAGHGAAERYRQPLGLLPPPQMSRSLPPPAGEAQADPDRDVEPRQAAAPEPAADESVFEFRVPVLPPLPPLKVMADSAPAEAEQAPSESAEDPPQAIPERSP